MEYSSIFHEPTSRYTYALSKGVFLIRIKTKKNDLEKIILHHQDKYIPQEYFPTHTTINMEKYASDSYNDYWEAEIKIDVICLRYYFELHDFSGAVSYFGNIDFYEKPIEDQDLMFDLPQNLREEEIFDIPEWAKNKIVYQIFSGRFGNHKKLPDEVWYKENLQYGDNFLGDIKGITDHIDHLKELGIDAIYLTPIFKSPSFHKYDTIDYYEIDPVLGTKEDFRELVETAHKNGIRIILDGVFNHTSRKFFAFDDVVQNGENSKYKNWYYFDSFPPSEIKRGEKPNFKSFAYYGGMPKTNLNNPDTERYFIEVGKYWIKEFGIDGWRLDVADEIVHGFWEKFRKEIREINPEALITGECWHFTPDYLQGTQWDSVMNYLFYNAIRKFTATESISATKALESLDFIKGNYHKKVYSVLWNHLDNHDTERFLYQAKEDKSKQHLAAAFQLLWEGMPMIYYGDEFALSGAFDPDCRRGMPWDEKRQDKEMFQWYKNLIKTRKENPVITEGKTIFQKADDERQTIIFKKELNGKTATILFCRSKNPVTLSEYKGKKDIITGKSFEGEISMDAKVFIE